MEGLRRGKGLYLLVGIIVTFAILINVDLVRAQTTGNLLLYQGQSGSVSVSPVAGFGVATVSVTSIGNRTLSGRIASFSPNTSVGFWTVLVIGTGGLTFADVQFGFLPWGGPSAVVDISGGVSFGLVTAWFFATTPDPVSYSLSVGQ